MPECCGKYKECSVLCEFSVFSVRDIYVSEVLQDSVNEYLGGIQIV